MLMVANWTFLANHAWAPPCIARAPEVRLRDIAASRGITERSATAPSPTWPRPATWSNRRTAAATATRFRHLPLPEPSSQEHPVGDVLAVIAGADARP
jgi:hypothetical protein